MLEAIVGHNIKSQRMQKHWTIEYLAGQCGLDAAHVGRIERGQHNATLTTLSRIARALNCRLCQLFNDDSCTDLNAISLFMMNNFFHVTQQTALSCFDELSIVIRNKLTIQDIEQGAYAANAEFYVTEGESTVRRNLITYGLTAVYLQKFGHTYLSFPDISSYRETVAELVAILNRFRPSCLHIDDVILDYMQTL